MHLLCRRRHRDRIRPESTFRPERGKHARADRGHRHPDHVVFQRHHRVIRNHPHVAAVADRHHPDTGLLRLLNRDLHRLRGDHDPDPLVRVDRGGSGALTHNLPVWTRVVEAILVVGHVAPQHVRHAVTVDTPHVRHHEHVGGQRRILLRHSHLLEDRLSGRPETRLRYVHGLACGNLKHLERHLSPSVSLEPPGVARGLSWST